MEKIILLGCGGHAKSVVDTIEACQQYEIAGFIDVKKESLYSYRNYKVIGDDNSLEEIYKTGIRNAIICIGYVGKECRREFIYKKLKEIGFYLPIIVDPTAIVASDVKLQEGIYVGKRAVINSNAVIEKMSIINTGAVIEHDCKIKEFSHIAVCATLCGQVEVGKKCFIGANATIIQSLKIGDQVIVGAGSTVLSNVDKNRTVVGIVT